MAYMAFVPTSVNDISTEWLNGVLKPKGVMSSDILAIETEIIGAELGLIGEVGRLHLSYGEKNAGPVTLVAKCAAQNENREIARFLDLYQREVDFYNHLSEQCPIRIPQCHYAAVKIDTYDCVLLLEDLGRVTEVGAGDEPGIITQNDQIKGSTAEETRHVIKEIALVHARWWNRARQTLPWAYDIHSKPELENARDLLYVPSLEVVLNNFSQYITEDMKILLKVMGDKFGSIFLDRRSSHETFIHGDYRQDNLITLQNQGQIETAAIDWQLSGVGQGPFDVAYFMCQSVTTDLRRQIEKDIVEYYHQSLLNNGVDNVSFDECWHDYRLWTLFCLVYPILSCGGMDLGNEKNKERSIIMLQRNLAAVDDLECREFVQGSL